MKPILTDFEVKVQERVSQKKLHILRFIKEYRATFQAPPSIREIGQECGIKSSGDVYSYLHRMEKEGMIILRKGVTRGIMLPEESDANS